mmetsp:Transcript_7471/g.11383  ORF Transcript_7471/g.11383 Transcript_7471/m.11383 type:complete len:164 (-) Transcript_7471:919-1410(-)
MDYLHELPIQTGTKKGRLLLRLERQRRSRHNRGTPSSEEGKLEGLSHASNDSNMCMHCTSIPAAVMLLKILQTAIDDKQKGTLDKKVNDAAKYVIRARYRLTSGKLPKDIGTRGSSQAPWQTQSTTGGIMCAAPGMSWDRSDALRSISHPHQHRFVAYHTHGW